VVRAYLPIGVQKTFETINLTEMLEAINLAIARLIRAANVSDNGNAFALVCGLGVLALVCLFR